ncbi:hypothetical protein HAX54_041670 [Datura stramonium]|uniref:Uncharacterized protein n=1 Tax=Datura stramonium TaxID=4076 RepID=A0ABS8W309_DATST|nr:hypothetical protein [Datura stramonium]
MIIIIVVVVDLLHLILMILVIFDGVRDLWWSLVANMLRLLRKFGVKKDTPYRLDRSSIVGTSKSAFFACECEALQEVSHGLGQKNIPCDPRKEHFVPLEFMINDGVINVLEAEWNVCHLHSQVAHEEWIYGQKTDLPKNDTGQHAVLIHLPSPASDYQHFDAFPI